MSWKNISDYLGKNQVVLEVGDGSESYGFQQNILMFEYVNRPGYSGGPIAFVKPFPGDGYMKTINHDFLVREVSKEEQNKIKILFEKKALDHLENELDHGFQIGSEIETFEKNKKKVLKPKFQGCLESHFYRLQEKIPNNKNISVKDSNGKFGKSVIKFSSGFKGKERKQAVDALDGILAVACVALFSNYKSMFPKASTVKSYKGASLSYKRIPNVWAMHPLCGNLVIDLSRKVAMFGKKGFYKFWEATTEEVNKVIKTNDVALARKILKRNKDIFIKILAAAYSDASNAHLESLFNVFMVGIHKNIKTPFKLSTNWLKQTEYDLDEPEDGEIGDFQIGANINELPKGTKF